LSIFWVWLAGAADDARLLAGYQFSQPGTPARIAFIMVTPRCGTGQSCAGALYIDCKVQQLDCGPIKLYKQLVGNIGAQQKLWRHLQETMPEAPEKMSEIGRPRRVLSP
jgi:hypothetical protein